MRLETSRTIWNVTLSVLPGQENEGVQQPIYRKKLRVLILNLAEFLDIIVLQFYNIIELYLHGVVDYDENKL